jgi:hypothetical protein
MDGYEAGLNWIGYVDTPERIRKAILINSDDDVCARTT